MVIVIDPKHRNEKNLRDLGDKIRQERKKDRLAVVSVFDDEKAARMKKDAAADRLNDEDGAFYDRHLIGSYFKNGAGVDEFVIFLDGLNGKEIRIKY
jgi:hypothetical protein